VRTLTSAGCNPVLVVLGAWIGQVDGADLVVNDAWPTGMASSLATGVRELQRTDADSVIITLVDLPGLSAEAVSRVLASPARIAVATYSGQRGHPVKLGREHWGPLIDVLAGDSGARVYLQGRDDVALVEVGDVADGSDLDEAFDTG
jgi:CTP:molybdopterin cytidylyltransferase MocA